MGMSEQHRADLLRRLFQAGIDAVGGRQASYNTLVSLEWDSPVHLVALGKAADAMASGALSAIGDRLVSALLVTKHAHLSDALRNDNRFECLESGHPVPDEASLKAGRRLVEFVAAVPAHHQLLFLVSGGTSALVEHLNEGLTLADLKRETDQLLASGAPIGEMNRQRRTLSQIKGGKLAQHVSCKVLQYLISDVPGDKLGDIGSGLLIPDEATGMSADLPVWQQINTSIIASSDIAQAAVAKAAKGMGIPVCQANASLHGDIVEVTGRIASVLCSENASPGLYIWGGEPTVVLPDAPGRGGRNQHLALALVPALAARAELWSAPDTNRSRGAASVLVCGTDGSDGPTADAGGLVNEKSAAFAASRQLDVRDYLARADAGTCLAKMDALVTTGPTGTNVMDLAIAYLE